MNYSAKEIMQYIEEEDVKFIRLAFCDIYGKQKNISVMPDKLCRSFDSGVAIDAASIAGFGGNMHKDLFLHPDPSTIAVLPWRPEHGKVVRMFCDIRDAGGNPFESDTRAVLKKAVADAHAEGLSFAFGSQMEFYLFKLDENGVPTKIPYDSAGYMDIAPDDKGENVRREICLTLEKMGILPESSHHEDGPGQNQIDFRFSDPLAAADNAVTFKSVVRTVAARNGLFADFSAKPLDGMPGDGFHINISVRKGTEKETKSDGGLLPSMIAGILEHAADMTVFLNPTESSYERLCGKRAPKYLAWSYENRTQLIRIPASFDDESRRIELCSPDPEANPYLAFALLIYASLSGITRGVLPPDASDLPALSWDAPEKLRLECGTLPLSLEQAKIKAADSAFLKSHLPEKILREYAN